MSNIFTIYGEINDDTIKDLLSSVDMASDKIVIYISSQGGDVIAMEILKHIIENTFAHIEIRATGVLESAALYLFFTLQANKRELIGEVVGMAHKATWEHDIQIGLNKKKLESAKEDFINAYNNKQRDMFKNILKMSDDEINDIFDNDEEVYFNTQRLTSLIND